jgi:anti-sigma B factor antagonist
MFTNASRLALSASTADGISTIAVEGELDLQTAVELKRGVLYNWAPDTWALVLDLSAVRLIDCAGITAVLDVKRRTRRRGSRLVLVCPESDPRCQFLVRGLDRLVDVRETREEALETVRRASPRPSDAAHLRSPAFEPPGPASLRQSAPLLG